MLKRYAACDRLQWSGKAWEIRHALRQELKRSGHGARVSDLLRDGRAPERDSLRSAESSHHPLLSGTTP